MLTYADLYHPTDAEAAHESWGANCGPVALAAILKRPVAHVRPLLDGFEQRLYMNPTHLRQALLRAGAHVNVRFPVEDITYGLLFLQWTGPWCQPGVPITAAYRYTHTIGAAVVQKHGMLFYDVNAWYDQETRGAWVPKDCWEREIKPLITNSIHRADGGYYARWKCQLTSSPV